MAKLKAKKREEAFYYGGGATAAFSDGDSKATIAMRLSLENARVIRDALTKTIARCELSLDCEIDELNMVLLTLFKHDGRLTVLGKKRVKPLKVGNKIIPVSLER